MAKRVTPATAQSPTATRAATPASRSQSSERTTASRRGASCSARSPARCDPAYSSISRPSVGVDGSCQSRAHVEELREHLLGRGSGGRPAVAAVLDHRADDELRCLHGTIAAPPRLVLLAGVAGERDDLLRRPGLARD